MIYVGIYLLIGLLISIAAGYAAGELPEWWETPVTMVCWPWMLYLGIKTAMEEDNE